MLNLTIVTSCTGYGKYLGEWARSIQAQTLKPAAVALVTHGREMDRRCGAAVVEHLQGLGIPSRHVHEPATLHLAVARNLAVSLADSEWVLHLDADDLLMPHALADAAELAPDADVVAMGYETKGKLTAATRLYGNANGLDALGAKTVASGCSPFRRAFWERAPYRVELLGAWDTGLWIDFARLGARFRGTTRPGFWYRQHQDSVYHARNRSKWQRELVQAQIKALRRGLPIPNRAGQAGRS